MVDDAEEQQEETMSIHSRTSARSSASAAHQIHRSNASSPLTSSMSNPDPKLYFYCHYHGWNLTHAGPECRVMSNDAWYARAQKQTTSPADTTPRGNDQIEPLQTDGRKRPLLKAWRTYSNWLPSAETYQSQTPETYQSPALPPRVSKTIATQSLGTEHRVFSIYSPAVTFTSDSGATDILMRQRDSHILLHYIPYTSTAARPGFDVTNFHQIYPIAHGKLQLPHTSILLTAFVFNDDDLHSNLFGVSPLTEHGLSATYTNDGLQITTPTPYGPKTILYGVNVWRQKSSIFASIWNVIHLKCWKTSIFGVHFMFTFHHFENAHVQSTFLEYIFMSQCNVTQ